MHNGTIQFLVYIGVTVWALVVSPERWRTALWMIGVWLGAWVAVVAFVYLKGWMNNGNGAAVADLWAIPSFAIPAIVGFIQVRRQRKRRF
jgi:hypothetical protein